MSFLEFFICKIKISLFKSFSIKNLVCTVYFKILSWNKMLTRALFFYFFAFLQ